MTEHKAPFSIVANMEDDLATIHDLVKAMLLLTCEMDEDFGIPMNRLCIIAMNSLDAAEEKRCELWRMTHPNRAHFEAEGWPGDKQEQEAA